MPDIHGRPAIRRDLSADLAAMVEAADAHPSGQAPKRPPANVTVHVHQAATPAPTPAPLRGRPSDVAVQYQRLRAAGLDVRLTDGGLGLDVPNSQAVRAHQILQGAPTDA